MFNKCNFRFVSHTSVVCVHNGTVYRSGSAMSTSSLCSYCYCFNGQQKCIKPKCLLPAPGCRPILSDSSCCPIRYDCDNNAAIHNELQPSATLRRSNNKHYLRLMSRTQRSRGMCILSTNLLKRFIMYFSSNSFIDCFVISAQNIRMLILAIKTEFSSVTVGCNVNETFYPEGQRLPTNSSQPCEICFCIRGKSECMPKKCAPSIRNCRPIIPDGECCPESYDCGN